MGIVVTLTDLQFNEKQKLSGKNIYSIGRAERNDYVVRPRHMLSSDKKVIEDSMNDGIGFSELEREIKRLEDKEQAEASIGTPMQEISKLHELKKKREIFYKTLSQGVSENHCEIVYAKKNFYLRRVDERNRLYLNGQELSDSDLKLASGDIITLSKYNLRFETQNRTPIISSIGDFFSMSWLTSNTRT